MLNANHGAVIHPSERTSPGPPRSPPILSIATNDGAVLQSLRSVEDEDPCRTIATPSRAMITLG